jgi:hypothetical protein
LSRFGNGMSSNRSRRNLTSCNIRSRDFRSDKGGTKSNLRSAYITICGISRCKCGAKSNLRSPNIFSNNFRCCYIAICCLGSSNICCRNLIISPFNWAIAFNNNKCGSCWGKYESGATNTCGCGCNCF